MADQLSLGQVDITDSQGRTLSGVGVSQESLQEAADQHDDSQPEPSSSDDADAPDARSDDTPPQVSTPTVARDAHSGQFQKPTRGQKRFDQLTREREEARREAQAEKERRETLEREISELRTRQTQTAPSGTAPASPASSGTVAQADRIAATQESAGVAATRPQPSEDDIGTKYQSYAQFVADTARWVVEQQQTDFETIAAKVWEQKETERQQFARGRELATSWDAATTRGRASYADFDRVIAPLVDLTLEGPLLDTLAAHPQAEHVAYRLMSDPTLRDAFVGRESNPYQRAMILGSLLSVGSPPAAPASGSAPVSTTAPPPYQPVGSRAKTTSPSAEDFAGGTGDVSDQYEKFRQFSRRR